MRSLILGGARSGKSAFAERIAQQSGRDVVYVATAHAGDDEMTERIAHHRARRPAHWQGIEAPFALSATLLRHAHEERLLLVDCLTLWMSNLLGHGDEARFTRERDAFVDVLPALPGEIVLVSNEVGLGIVPMGELTRRFVDETGRLHQALAPHCDRVAFVAAGLPLALKGSFE
jgi:adenosylcobinamide kinase / adenosylcobinamide-phosphate guanylyltransferase